MVGCAAVSLPKGLWLFGTAEDNVPLTMMCISGVFKGLFSVLGRSSDTEKLYDMDESSMDAIEGFAPQDTGGFIGVQAIRLKKYGSMKAEAGEKM